MVEAYSQRATNMDPKELESLAQRWLQSVHAVWEPKVVEKQPVKDGVQLRFVDWYSQRHTVLMDRDGHITEYEGPSKHGAARTGHSSPPMPEAMPEETASITPPEAIRPRVQSAERAPQAAPRPEGRTQIKDLYSAPAVAAEAPRSPEERMTAWIRESLGVPSVQIGGREAREDSIRYTIIDPAGNYYSVTADKLGGVQRFEPLPYKPKAEPRPADAPRQAEAAADASRLVDVSRAWLSNTIGLNTVELLEQTWDGGRLRIVLKDPGGNRYRLFVRPPDKVEEFKPL